MTEATLSALSTRTEKLMVKFGEGVLSLVNMDKPARDLRALVKQLNVSPEQLKSATELSFYDKDKGSPLKVSGASQTLQDIDAATRCSGRYYTPRPVVIVDLMTLASLNPHLKRLDLSFCDVKNLRYIREFRDLQWLSLLGAEKSNDQYQVGMAITPGEKRHFLGLQSSGPKLKHLNIKFTNLADDAQAVREIQEDNPHCRIDHKYHLTESQRDQLNGVPYYL